MAPTPPARVAACIVTHDSAADVAACLAALAAQDHSPLEVVLVDCASRDGTLEAARAAAGGLRLDLVALAENRGFAGGMNAALARSDAPYVLSLNPDARPSPAYVACLLERLEAHPQLQVGAVTGRLLRPAAPGEPPRLDACGMRLTPAWRHLDRGSGEIDRGQLSLPERVFGCTGAASLFRRRALDDAAVGGEVFDSAFHSFREDAELCLRLRERGWEILYEPTARAVHGRRVLPERRRGLPAAVNFHSLKNRYLLRCGHQRVGNLVRTLPWTLTRDLGALAWVVARERSSLAAYGWLWRHRRELRQRRRALRASATAPAAAVERWFAVEGEPV